MATAQPMTEPVAESTAEDASESTVEHDVTAKKMIISKILCYIQSKMNTTEHDFMIKSVVSYFSEDDIHEAKILLFEECKQTNLRLKTYRNDGSKHDCEDIVNKY